MSAPSKVRVATTLATWFGCGFSPVAPGTVGTLGALPLYLLLRAGGPFVVLGAAAVLCVVGIWASGVVADARASKDPQIVVLDEVVGVLVSLSFAHPTWPAVAAAVVLFRIFDITKLAPARWAERTLPGGFGIMLDDVVAGIWGALCVFALQLWGVV